MANEEKILKVLEQVQAGVAKVQSDVAKLQSDVAKVQSDVAKVQADVVEMKSEIARVESKVDGVRERIILMEQDQKHMLGGLYDAYVLMSRSLEDIAAGYSRAKHKLDEHEWRLDFLGDPIISSYKRLDGGQRSEIWKMVKEIEKLNKKNEKICLELERESKRELKQELKRESKMV